MAGLKGFGGKNAFNNSKIVSDKKMAGVSGKIGFSTGNHSKSAIGLTSKKKGAKNPTDGGGEEAKVSSRGGASGDKKMGVIKGVGSNSLKGAQGRY